MSNASDFIIENGVLKKYVGPGGDVVIPEGVTEIGDNAFCMIESAQGFEYCIHNTTLTGVSLPKGLRKIGESAFDNCVLLSKVVFPESLKEIGAKAFRSTNLIDIHIPRSVNKIGDSAFSYLGTSKVVNGEVRIRVEDDGVTGSVRIDGTPKFGKGVFERKYSAADYCDGKIHAEFDMAESIPLFPLVLSWSELWPASRISLVLQMLRKTDSFRKADIEYLVSLIKRAQKSLYPELVKEFDAGDVHAFLKLGLLDAENADTVLELFRDRPEERALIVDYIAKNITLEKSAEAAEKKLEQEIAKQQKRYKAIEEALALFSQKKPAEIKKEWAVSEIDSGLMITKYKGKDTSIVVPSSIGKTAVLEIAEDAMRAAAGDSGKKNTYQKNMYKNKCIVIQSGIQKIGARVFKGCVYLTDVVIPDSVTEIGQEAFADCHKLNIHAPTNSCAEQYAKENNIPFVTE